MSGIMVLATPTPLEWYKMKPSFRYKFYSFAAQQLSDQNLMDPHCPALLSLPMLYKQQKLGYM